MLRFMLSQESIARSVTDNDHTRQLDLISVINLRKVYHPHLSILSVTVGLKIMWISVRSKVCPFTYPNAIKSYMHHMNMWIAKRSRQPDINIVIMRNLGHSLLGQSKMEEANIDIYFALQKYTDRNARF